MKRTFQWLLISACTMALAGTAAATNFSQVAQSSGSAGNSTLGANFQASLTAWVDSTRQNLGIRGYVWAEATLLGLKKNLVIINGTGTVGTSYGTEVNTYLLGQQVFAYKDSFGAAFTKTFSAIDWRSQFWSRTASWTFLGTGVTIRLAVDGGTSLTGTISGAPRRISGQLNPRVWVDAGGSLSFHLLWISAGSLSGSIRLVDAQGWGVATIDATAFPDGPTQWSVMGWGKLCTGGGAITGCIPGKCGTLVSWGSYCPDWLMQSGSASGSL